MVAKYKASWSSPRNLSLSLIILGALLLYSSAAFARSSLYTEISLMATAISIVGIGMARSMAFCDVHLPVPFEPALSRIISTIAFPVSASLCVNMSAVISNKKDCMSPSFHFLKTSCNSSLDNSAPRFRISYTSLISCMRAYSIPLCTIFT